MLRAQLVRRVEKFDLDVALEVLPGRTLVVAGESGAGKTTLLRVLAGLDSPDRGEIAVNGTIWFDSNAGISLSAREREVGYVAQDYSLFPHLSVFENVAFGLRAEGLARAEVSTRVASTLDQLNVGEFASRRSGELSGGQQQRVALARALVLRPKLLLLDEPQSALDLATRRSVRAELRRLLSELPCVTVYVTHSPMEAMVFGDQIAVMESGRITQEGTRDDLLRHPRSAFVAEFMGVNLFQGAVVRRDGEGLAQLETREGTLAVVDPGEEHEVFVAVNPREITLFLDVPAGSAQNVFHGAVTELVPEPPFGERVRVALATHPPLVAEVTRQAVETLGLHEGLAVYAAFKATGVIPYR